MAIFRMIKEVSGVINQLEKKATDDNAVPTNYYHYFIWFLSTAFLLLLIDIFISEKKRV